MNEISPWRQIAAIIGVFIVDAWLAVLLIALFVSFVA